MLKVGGICLHAFLSSAVFISKSNFSKNYFMNTNSVKNNRLDPDQAP